MDTVSRRKRLEQDFATLVALRSDSPLFEFDPADEVSSLYIVRFSGRGLGPVDVIGRPSLVSQHEVEVRLPLDYPEQPPDIRWLSSCSTRTCRWAAWFNWRTCSCLGQPTWGSMWFANDCGMSRAGRTLTCLAPATKRLALGTTRPRPLPCRSTIVRSDVSARTLRTSSATVARVSSGTGRWPTAFCSSAKRTRAPSWRRLPSASGTHKTFCILDRNRK